MRSYEYQHVVGFEETNLVGNVYYANHIRWQGRCREMFLFDHGIDILKEFAEGLAMVTLGVSCEYLAELQAFDTVKIRMTLKGIVQNRIMLRFEYWKGTPMGEELIARGEQQIGCMRRTPTGLEPVAIPDQLRDALKIYEA